MAHWEAGVDPRLPLHRVRTALQLDGAGVLALLLAGMVEEDARFAEVFAAANGGRARRPTVGLMHHIALAAHAAPAVDPWSLVRPLVEAGLTEVLNPGDPRAEWQLRVPVQLWSALGGDTPPEPLSGVRWHSASAWPTVEELVLAEEQRRRLVEARSLLSARGSTALLVRGLPGSERLELIGALGRDLGLGVLEAHATGTTVPDVWRLVGPLATLTGSLPALVLDLAPGELFTLPRWGGYGGPVGVVLGHDGGVAGSADERTIVLHLPPDPPEVRRLHWARALPHAGTPTHNVLAQSFTLGGRYVRQAAELAITHAALDGRTAVEPADVRAAGRSINRQQLDSLATRLEDGGGWDSLVLHPSTTYELRHLERRCRQRERLTVTLAGGLPGGMNRGVRALFQGPSGTGKTLAARVLAEELGLDLYRVDLSSVVSKYIGETEKNLSRVLGRAEDLDVVLLLDEGDSLLGKRTQVRSAHDRWANMETNYLLQRLDTYTGIVVVTTNLPGSVDSAFQRRMDAVVRFHLPDAEERWHLWLQHLPADHEVDARVVEDAAVRYKLTGGQIRNAAVDAALLGLTSHDGRVRAHDLDAAVDAEYRKAGASSPRTPPPEDASGGDALSAFLGTIR